MTGAYRSTGALDRRIVRALAHEQRVAVRLVSLRAGVGLGLVVLSAWLDHALLWGASALVGALIVLATGLSVRRLHVVATTRRRLARDARALVAVLEGPSLGARTRRLALELDDGASLELLLPAELVKDALDALAEARPDLEIVRDVVDFTQGRHVAREQLLVQRLLSTVERMETPLAASLAETLPTALEAWLARRAGRDPEAVSGDQRALERLDVLLLAARELAASDPRQRASLDADGTVVPYADEAHALVASLGPRPSPADHGALARDARGRRDARRSDG